ncbi:hypothetical protein BAUCODRAFT_470491 [Baudoinia panamericana UAMH 10762]|uniref:Nuclear protein DGCR14 n=1 Tax=Baudoinia panamericana (strain UAMH 10762) TaxID=717646 RepID=M2LPK2_BAUPA|nr:uncharacterized protein BAUCODRAFT_470491 [Baudoinia panamericana UAMH 10762]EMC96327.1 hypothetical protein BAUCODRAFT_470491 [Baudoinia panamericana UAMH 10762]
MALRTSQALVKRSADQALMPPPPTRRIKRPKNVLKEDVYSDALSHIIARDFYPGLLETEAQQEYLSALDSNNNEWIREASRRLTQVMTPGPDGRRKMMPFTPRRTAAMLSETPRGYTGGTPSRTPVDVDHFTPEEERPNVNVNMSLASFQGKYTSEDNESFYGVLDKQNQRRANKYAFFHHGNKIPTARQIAHRAREQKLIEDGKRPSISTALVTTNAGGEERLAIAHARPSEDLDARPASLDGFRNSEGPRNHFMFGPESVEDSMSTRAQEAEQASNAPPKSVTYTATRFQTDRLPAEGAVPPSPSISAIDAAIAGRPKPTESEAGYSGAETPRVNGYAFVDAEPTPSELGIPVTDEEADAAEREAAMALLPKIEEGKPNPFHVSERSKREELHHRLVEKADAGRRRGGRMEQLRSLGITPGGTPTPRFSSAPNTKKQRIMTPAARMLAASLGTPKKERSGFDEDRDNQKATPKVKRMA